MTSAREAREAASAEGLNLYIYEQGSHADAVVVTQVGDAFRVFSTSERAGIEDLSIADYSDEGDALDDALRRARAGLWVHKAFQKKRDDWRAEQRAAGVDTPVPGAHGTILKPLFRDRWQGPAWGVYANRADLEQRRPPLGDVLCWDGKFNVTTRVTGPGVVASATNLDDAIRVIVDAHERASSDAKNA